MSPRFVRYYTGWHPYIDLVTVTRERGHDVYRMRLIHDGVPGSHIDVIVYTNKGRLDGDGPAGAATFTAEGFSEKYPFVFTACEDTHTAVEATKRLAEKIADPDDTICDIGPCSPADDMAWAVLNQIHEWDGQPFDLTGGGH